jgi:cell pole-organizing protein PopZ
MDARNEPSMEEILASIKRIIAEDGAPDPSAGKARLVRQGRPKARVGRAVALAAESEEPDVAEAQDIAEAPDIAEAEVLELTQAMPDDADEAGLAGIGAEAVNGGAAPAFQPGIASEGATHASRQALAALSAMIVKPSTASDNSLEGLVRDMLRPMLKEWLDIKLPEIVEAMVAQEIARISGRKL